jgi:hypothetical protein
MATSTNAAPQLTRQQLDDLDALLQRMLQLPVKDLEEPIPSSGPKPRFKANQALEDAQSAPLSPSHSSLSETLEYSPNLSSDEPRGNMLVPPPGNLILTDPLPSLLKPSPSSAPGPEDTGEDKARDTGQWFESPEKEQKAGKGEIVSPAWATRTHGRFQTSVSSRPPEVGLWLRPLVWGNRLFDSFTLGLGAPGRWLRRPGGRSLLGWTGLILLAGAITLVVLGRIGWTW